MEPSQTRAIVALRHAADYFGESPTKAQYEELGVTPSSGTIIRTFGSWNRAKEAADLETYPSRGSRTAPKPDAIELPADTRWEELTVDQRWYYKNAKEDNEYELERRSRLRDMIAQYKTESGGCRRCGEQGAVRLDFHHPEPDEKVMAVNKMVPNGYSRADIRSEMAKCELLCANCHKKLHISPRAVPTKRWLAAIDDPLPSNDFGMDWFPNTISGLRNWSVAYRRISGCSRCDETDPRCLEFHHTSRSKKRGSVGNMIANRADRAHIAAEVATCEVLCSNCHRTLHSSKR